MPTSNNPPNAVVDARGIVRPTYPSILAPTAGTVPYTLVNGGVLAIYGSAQGGQASPQASAPKVSSVSPAICDSSGGTAITITGSGFTGATSAWIGGSVCTSFVLVNDTTITAVSPALPLSTQAYDLIVVNPVSAGALYSGISIFSPPSIAGLLAWFRGDFGVTTATGVSAWADGSGSGDPNKNLIQPTTAKQPAFTPSDAAYNNRPTLTFARASTQGLSATGNWSVALAQPFTVYAVGNTDGTTASQDFCDGNSVGQRLEFGGGAVATNLSMFGGSFITAAAAMGSKGAFAALVNGAASNLYANAITPILSGANPGASAPTGLNLGYAYDTTSDTLNGKMAEFIVYSGAHTSAQIASVLKYLGTRYAITIGA